MSSIASCFDRLLLKRVHADVRKAFPEIRNVVKCVITDAWGGYNGLPALGYQHLPAVEGNDPNVAEEYLPINLWGLYVETRKA